MRWCKCRSDDFNPRPPRGERLGERIDNEAALRISIHALREESDGEYYNTEHHWKIFQSTPSARRATSKSQAVTDVKIISIHALREESDRAMEPSETRGHDFNPRPPRGERRLFSPKLKLLIKFQSTPSARRATDMLDVQSPHKKDFNPCPPRGERHTALGERIDAEKFQSTPSARRATLVLAKIQAAH